MTDAPTITRGRREDLPALLALAPGDDDALARTLEAGSVWCARRRAHDQPDAWVSAAFVDGVAHLTAIVGPPEDPDGLLAALVDSVRAWAVAAGAAAITATAVDSSDAWWRPAGFAPPDGAPLPHLVAELAAARDARVAIERSLVDEVEAPLRAHLDALGVPFRVVRHPPVRTVAEAQAITGALPGVHVKNLFLRDKSRNYWLLTALDDAAVDLRALRDPLGARGSLSFASADRLRERLRVQPGAVTPVAVVHDPERVVTARLDARVLGDGRDVLCHPLHNRATFALTPDELRAVMAVHGHDVATLVP